MEDCEALNSAYDTPRVARIPASLGRRSAVMLPTNCTCHHMGFVTFLQVMFATLRKGAVNGSEPCGGNRINVSTTVSTNALTTTDDVKLQSQSKNTARSHHFCLTSSYMHIDLKGF